MEDPVLTISLPRLAIAFVPALLAVGIMSWWSLGSRTGIYALTRMLLQLAIIGYLLTYIFGTNNSLIVVCVLIVMLAAACWISLRPLQRKDTGLYANAFAAIAVGGILTLFLITGLVLELEPWFLPRYMIPLAGMIFASSMNAVSLAAERLESESVSGVPYEAARQASLKAALIPVINSLFAVGLVSLPGMMTGQILAGASPLLAARYQIVVMCMLFGASGISAALYLTLARPLVSVAEMER